MALSPSKTAKLREAADKLAGELPEDERAQFKVDYVEVMADLNAAIETRLDAFEDAATSVLVAMVPNQPRGVYETVQKWRGAVLELTDAAVVAIGNAPSTAVQVLMVEALKDTLNHGLGALVEGARRAEARAGVRAS